MEEKAGRKWGHWPFEVLKGFSCRTGHFAFAWKYLEYLFRALMKGISELHTCTLWHSLVLIVSSQLRWRLMGETSGVSISIAAGVNGAKSCRATEQRRMHRDKEPRVESHGCTLPPITSMQQQTFPQPVNCGSDGRLARLVLINLIPNYRLEGKRRAASAQISPNEPPCLSLLPSHLPQSGSLAAPAFASHKL